MKIMVLVLFFLISFKARILSILMLLTLFIMLTLSHLTPINQKFWQIYFLSLLKRFVFFLVGNIVLWQQCNSGKKMQLITYKTFKFVFVFPIKLRLKLTRLASGCQNPFAAISGGWPLFVFVCVCVNMCLFAYVC